MKNTLIVGLALLGLLGLCAACNHTPKIVNNDPNAVYACPMHPEVTGKAGDKCAKCGMALEPIKAEGSTTYACSMHPEVTGMAGDKCSKCGMALTAVAGTAASTTTTATTTNVPAGSTVSIKPLVDGYLQMKNAFTTDNTRDAAAAGKALEAAFKGFDKSALTEEQKKTYAEIEEEAREHAEHIGANSGKIEHQREHFAMLSKDMYDLVKTFGVADQPLYQDFCPMYDKGKGAIWLSETKEIKNPYYGQKMATCGKMKEEIK